MSCHIGAYPLRSSLLASLSELFFGFEQLDQVIHHFMAVSIRVWGCTYIDRSSPCHVSSVSKTAPISIGHCLFESESRLHLYQSSIFLSFPCQFEFLGIAPISIDRHLICLSLSWNHTYIDRSFILSVWVGAVPISISHHLINLSSIWVRAAPISIGHFLIRLSLVFESGQHLYRLVIHHVSLSRDRTYIDRSLFYQLEFRVAPISIGHLLVMLV